MGFPASNTRKKVQTSSTSNARVECNLLAEVEALFAGAETPTQLNPVKTEGSSPNSLARSGKKIWSHITPILSTILAL